MGIKVKRFKVGELVSVSKPSVNADMIVAEVPNIPAGIIFKKSRTIDHFYTVYYNNIFYPNIHATWISRLSKWGHAK